MQIETEVSRPVDHVRRALFQLGYETWMFGAHELLFVVPA